MKVVKAILNYIGYTFDNFPLALLSDAVKIIELTVL